MIHQALARKWRPQQFNQVVGQTPVLKILENSLSLGRIHHAYLFSGTRGVGKTSIARLFVKGLNCEKGITAEPCGVCQNCVEIEQGKFIDLIEIDAASRTKVEDTREILDNVQYLPTQGRFKVYLIDEVHMLSKSSFNALLKTLEEPPEYVKFLLATTDPQKIPITILSRCLQLHLQALSEVQIQNQLSFVLNQEKIQYDESALYLLAKYAHGSLRDGLSLTDQAIALGNGAIEKALVHDMLGLLSDELAIQIVESIQSANGTKLMHVLTQAFANGVDHKALLDQTMQLLYQISLYQALSNTIKITVFDSEQVKRLARQSSAQEIQLFYQILLDSTKSIETASDKKLVAEMAFLRALAFIPKQNNVTLRPLEQTNNESENPQQQAVAVPLSTPNSNEIQANHLNGLKNQQMQASIQVMQNPAKAETPKPSNLTTMLIHEKAQLTKTMQTTSVEPNVHPTIKPIQSKKEFEPKKKTALKENLAPTQQAEPILDTKEYQWQFSDSAQEELDKKTLDVKAQQQQFSQKIIDRVSQKDAWSAEVENLNLFGLLKQILLNAFVVKTNDHYELHLRSHASFLVQKKETQKKLEQALSKQLQKPISLNLVIDDDQSYLTPFELREQEYQIAQQEAFNEIKNDAKVDLICQFFNTSVDEKSIHPV